MEFNIDLTIVEKYLEKYGFNHPDDFLIYEDEVGGKTSYIFDENDLSEYSEDIPYELNDLFRSRVKVQPNFKYFQELCFIITYLDYYNRNGLMHNQTAHSYYSNLRSLIQVAIGLKLKASPTKLNINLVTFEKNSHNNKHKVRYLEPVEFDLFQHTSSHLTLKGYLELLARLVNISTVDKVFKKASDNNTTIEELEILLKKCDIQPIEHSSNLKYVYAALITDFLDNEMKFIKKSKGASSEQIEIIYYVLARIGLIPEVDKSGASLKPLDSLRKDINRKILNPLK